MSEQGPRIFIPTGACVEEPTAGLFNSPETSAEAIDACNGCAQLEHCRSQQLPIGDALALSGLTHAVVGGELLELKKKQDEQLAVAHFEHGEPTFTFKLQPLPSNGERGLWALQQAYRSGQLYGRKQQHPSINVEQLLANSVRDRDEQVYQQSMEATEVRSIIVTLILSAVSLRKPCGIVYAGERRYEGFDPYAYTEVAWCYALQAAGMQELGLSPQRAALHSPAFYQRYYEAGQSDNIPAGLLRAAAQRYKRQLLPAAMGLRNDNKRQYVKDRRQSVAPSPGITLEAESSKTQKAADKYGIVQRVNGVLGLNTNLDHLDRYERAAVIYTYDLQELVDPGMSLAELHKQHPSPAQLTHTALLPNVFAAHTARTLIERGAISTERFLLQQIRTWAWSGQLRPVRKGKADPDTSLRDSLLQRGGVETIERNLLKGAERLHILAKRYFFDHGTALDSDTLYKIGLAYINDARTIQHEGQPDAARVSLYYNPATYRSIRDYGTQKYPEVPPSVVRRGFIQNIRAPLRKPAQTVQRYYELRPLLAEFALGDSDIKQLAIRSVGDEDAKRVAALANELIAEVGGILPDSFVRNYCATRSFDPEALRVGILQHARERRAARA